MSNLVPTYAEFILAFPVLVPPAVTEQAVEYQINYASQVLCKLVWADWYSDGILYVAAHNLSMWLKTQASVNGGSSAASGPVSSASGAGLSITYGTIYETPGSQSAAWYNRTAYGQQYLQLRTLVVSPAYLAC